MTELEKGPRGLRRGRGARERILSASQQLFRDQGINCTGIDQLCAVAQASKRTLYQHFAGKDELIAEHLRRFDPDVLPEVFDRTDLAPREQLALLLDGASARSRVLDADAFATAAEIAAVLIDDATPTAAVPPGADGDLSAGTGPRARSGSDLS
jgi:AcrR family transcriptional regulator